MSNTKFMLITPELAAEWLAPHINMGNRPTNKREIDKLAKLMTDGEFRYNGDTIRFAPSGRLLDGQHRLEACVLSGVPFRTLVVYDVPENAFSTIDGGRKRRADDFLSEYKVIDGATMAAAIRWIIAYDMGEWWYRGHATSKDVVEFFKANRHVQESVHLSVQLKGLLSKSTGAGAHFILSRVDPEAATTFINDLGRGVGLDESDPVWVLRERLIRTQSGRVRTPQIEVMTLLIRAWNARRQGQTPKKLLAVVKQESGVLRAA